MPLPDETARLRAEAETWKNKYESLQLEQKKWLLELGHKLRTPLTSIKSFAEILSRYPDEKPAQQTEFLRIILEETQRLNEMLNTALDAAPVVHAKDPSAGHALPDSQPKILIIDDEENLTKSLTYFLSKRDFHVLTASNLRQAQQVLQYSNPDAIFLDIFLPDGNGYDFCGQLKAAKPKRPVILMSAKSEERNRLRALDVKADGFIAKPFSFDEVVATLHNLAVVP